MLTYPIASCLVNIYPARHIAIVGQPSPIMVTGPHDGGSPRTDGGGAGQPNASVDQQPQTTSEEPWRPAPWGYDRGLY